jgi:hypothetical protein
MELILILVFVALFAYAFGAGKQKRELSKRKIAEYNRQWEEWRVKYKAVQDEHGKWHPTINPDQDSKT